jgi:hypothetical protein
MIGARSNSTQQSLSTTWSSQQHGIARTRQHNSQQNRDFESCLTVQRLWLVELVCLDDVEGLVTILQKLLHIDLGQCAIRWIVQRKKQALLLDRQGQCSPFLQCIYTETNAFNQLPYCCHRLSKILSCLGWSNVEKSTTRRHVKSPRSKKRNLHFGGIKSQ